jgi:hypothetical protein
MEVVVSNKFSPAKLQYVRVDIAPPKFDAKPVGPLFSFVKGANSLGRLKFPIVAHAQPTEHKHIIQAMTPVSNSSLLLTYRTGSVAL